MRTSKKDFVYDALLQRLIVGEYKMGEEIRVSQIVSELGTSRQPVLAALNAFALDGFVEIVPQVGCRVVHPSAQDVSDFYIIFGRFERAMAELGATRRTNKQLNALKELNRNIRELFKSGELTTEEYRTRNRDFHRAMHQTANSDLIDMYQARFFDMSDFFVGQTIGFRPHMSEALDEHDAVIEGIEAQDSEKAGAAAEAHISKVARALLNWNESEKRLSLV